MAKHRTFFGKIFGSFWDLIKKAFKDGNKAFLEVAIKITNELKAWLNSGIVDIITKLIPGDIDDKIVELLRGKLPVILSDLLLLKNLDENPTPEQVQITLDEIGKSFGALSDEKKARFYTSLAAEIYIFLQNHTHGEKVTFGQAARLVETSWELWQQSQQEAV